ncbi:GtrA family protein [Microbacterium trichothecenolyticum]|uniref:Flippase GtrA n=1 Tax=Microbacterium trichothecenolyticum TaxID=69370 RepID=A0ABU0TUL0_MICTR|nr:GtrA family protein [Microbacterium trichothecenolyticum]MDQ1123343.1 putative flippase GtrA [Microbacterium trichothecenolyticum]
MTLVGRSRNLRRAGALSVRFLVVGAVSTAIEITAFNLLLLTGLGPVAAKVFASLIALVNAYFGNREWAFRSRARTGAGRQMLRFLVVNALCTVIGASAVWLGARALEATFGVAGPVGLNIVNVVSIAAVTVIRFLLYHYVVFPPTRAIPELENPSGRLGP